MVALMMGGPIEPVVVEKPALPVGPVLGSANERMIPILRSVGTESFLTGFENRGLIVLEKRGLPI